MNIYLSENIKRLRLHKQVTQEQLSIAMGVSCAAVSKWERGETFPDISLLPLLANYFDVSIDELMGYDVSRIELEIKHFLEEHERLEIAEAIKLSEKAYKKYPNDYRIMNTYMWDKAGSYADNDISVLLAHKEEFLSICQRILDSCHDVFLRLDAINMQGKLLHAEGKTNDAIALYKQEIPNWYLTQGQKIEQLFAKDSPEFAHYLKFNMLELGYFSIKKKCMELWFCNHISIEEKGLLALNICTALQSLQNISSLYEINYYLFTFAKDMAYRLKYNSGNTTIIERLFDIANDAKQRFIEYSKTDNDIMEYSKFIK